MLLVDVMYGGFGPQKVRYSSHPYKVYVDPSSNLYSLKGVFRDYETKETIYEYKWNKYLYPYPILSGGRLIPEQFSMAKSKNDYQRADIEIAKLLINKYYEMTENRNETIFDPMSYVFDYEEQEEEIRFEIRNSADFIEPTPEQVHGIQDEIRFAPYPLGSKEKKLTGTPVWFMEIYKIMTPCYKRIPDGTAHELDLLGEKIWLYDRHTRINNMDPILKLEAERILKEVLRPWCNLCKHTDRCVHPCIDISDLVDESSDDEEPTNKFELREERVI